MLKHGVWILAVLLALTAGWTDWRFRRIPNWITVPALLLGIGLNTFVGGWPGARSSLLGAGLGFVLLLPFALARGLGMGDLKLVVALGAILGPQHLIVVLFATILLNAIIAVAMMVQKKRVRQTLRNLGHMLAAFLSLHLPGPDLTIDNPELVKVPFGVACAVAVILYTASQAWKFS